jgi:hypothetical protein
LKWGEEAQRRRGFRRRGFLDRHENSGNGSQMSRDPMSRDERRALRRRSPIMRGKGAKSRQNCLDQSVCRGQIPYQRGNSPRRGNVEAPNLGNQGIPGRGCPRPGGDQYSWTPQCAMNGAGPHGPGQDEAGGETGKESGSEAQIVVPCRPCPDLEQRE